MSGCLSSIDRCMPVIPFWSMDTFCGLMPVYAEITFAVLDILYRSFHAIVFLVANYTHLPKESEVECIITETLREQGRSDALMLLYYKTLLIICEGVCRISTAILLLKGAIRCYPFYLRVWVKVTLLLFVFLITDIIFVILVNSVLLEPGAGLVTILSMFIGVPLYLVMMALVNTHWKTVEEWHEMLNIPIESSEIHFDEYRPVTIVRKPPLDVSSNHLMPASDLGLPSSHEVQTSGLKNHMLSSPEPSDTDAVQPEFTSETSSPEPLITLTPAQKTYPRYAKASRDNNERWHERSQSASSNNKVPSEYRRPTSLGSPTLNRKQSLADTDSKEITTISSDNSDVIAKRKSRMSSLVNSLKNYVSRSDPSPNTKDTQQLPSESHASTSLPVGQSSKIRTGSHDVDGTVGRGSSASAVAKQDNLSHKSSSDKNS